MCSSLFDLFFTTSRVGPIHDDLTMYGIAAAFGRRTQRHPELESTLRQYYSRDLLDGNLRMADVPDGARLVGGKGMWFPVIAVENVYIFPGVPEILRRKFERIKQMFREAPFHLREIYLRDEEGQIAAILHHVLSDYPDLMMVSYTYFDTPIYSFILLIYSYDASFIELLL